jgi:hypothetical protein
MNDGSISDLYYDEESNTVKNHKNEVVAYFAEGLWHCKGEELESTYCAEISHIIQSNLEGAGANPEDIIIKIKRAISQSNKNKLLKNPEVKDAAIALDLNPEDLNPIQIKMSKIFRKNKIKYSRIKNLHVSTAYLLGHNKLADLAELIDTISNYNYEFKVTGIEVLSGATTDKDYIVLKLSAPDNFYKALHKIEEESNVLKFPGGFKTHISLYSVLKNSLTPEVLKQLKNLFEKEIFTLNHSVTIKPQSVSLFNNSKLLELRQQLRQAFKKV